MGGLLGVADGEDHGIHPLDREGIGLPLGGEGVFGGLSHGRSVSPIHKVRNTLRFRWAICIAVRKNHRALCTG
ncbi:hypothetical protein GCM10010218_18320 [Streptomyces mashuensis]|uniref:Uncharacterized protein n=1 Tax=Streptomyces mashuensis TaxID=33904 RepID=A0A919B2M6_9ACTN|nr:hypothetical protein GCM10010218_18320 [Streptomyces mashuensis]